MEEYVKMEVYPRAFYSEEYSEIFLVNEDMALPIYISHVQAESIMNGLHGIRFQRPFTHDLFSDVINSLGASINRIVIDDLVDGIFMAKMYIEQYRGGEVEEIVIDARPSDCIALAVREGCDILVSKHVLQEAGRRRDEIDI